MLGSKIGVLLEVNCETDFVARNEEFQTFVKELAMQVAAAIPSYVKREDVPDETLEREKGDLPGPGERNGKTRGRLGQNRAGET